MFMTAFIRRLGIIDNSLAILRLMVESAKPEDRAAIVSRHEARVAKFEKIGDWFQKRAEIFGDDDPKPAAVPAVPPKA